MKSKNTFQYSQPSFYSFSEDSLKLVDFSLPIVKNLSSYRCIDLGAGCGIVGIEAYLKIKEIQKVTFLEIQEDFISHIEQNIKIAGLKNAEIVHSSIEQWRPEKKEFDLLYANIPYFLRETGRIPKNSKRARCRFYVEEERNKFLEKAASVISKNGLFFVAMREFDEVNILKHFVIEDLQKLKNCSLLCVSRLNKN